MMLVYKGLGLVDSRRGAALYWGMIFGGGGAGAGSLWWWGGPGFAGLGLPLGVLAALVIYPVATRLRACATAGSGGLVCPRSGLLIALAAGMAGHLAEASFAFQVSSSALLFWVYIGLVLALSSSPVVGVDDGVEAGASARTSEADGAVGAVGGWPAAEAGDVSSRKPALSDYQPALYASFVAVCVCLPLVYVFLHLYPAERLTSFEILRLAFAQSDSGALGGALTLGALAFAWVLATWLAMARHGGGAAGRAVDRGRFLFSLMVSGVVLGLYASAKSSQYAALGAFPDGATPVTELVRKCVGYETIYLTFILVLVLLLFAGGVVCGCRLSLGRCSGAMRKAAVLAWLSAVGALLMALIAGYVINIKPVLADVALHWAEGLYNQGVRTGSIPIYARAVRFDPWTFAYRRDFSLALRDHAERLGDAEASRRMMGHAEQVLVEAIQISSLNQGPYFLADLYLVWAAREEEPGRRMEVARKGIGAFHQAGIFESNSELIQYETALLNLLFLNDPAEAVRRMQLAAALARGNDIASFGHLYASKAHESRNAVLKDHYGRRALSYYDRAMGATRPEDRRFREKMFAYRWGKAKTYLVLGDPGRALENCRDALEVATEKERESAWQVYETMANIYFIRRERENALFCVTKAEQQAPLTKRRAVRQLRERIENM
jgi:tetratricopeptide (TPR) repeat protein